MHIKIYMYQMVNVKIILGRNCVGIQLVGI